MTETAQTTLLIQRDGYAIYQAGKHAEGTFIRVYIPDGATQPGTPLQTITYLHGFALCMPSFYEQHLEHLVLQGYIVFFPDFQRSCYPNTPPDGDIPDPVQPDEFNHLGHWYAVATHLPGERDRLLSAVETPQLPDHGETVERLGPGFSAPVASDVRGVAKALVMMILILKVWSWFRKEYAKHLIHLLSTVAISLFHQPTESLDNAILLTQKTWDDLCDRFPHWHDSSPESFAFGHSLGGLMALSLPFGYHNKTDQRFFPTKIVVADPAASTEMGIPGFAIALLKLFHAPFTNAPISVIETGQRITNTPVVILHGSADQLVKPQTWRNAQGKNNQNFDRIGTSDKQVYFSDSNVEKDPSLIAFHNQAVTSTQYYDDGLFENFGGVKDGPNAYDFDYVWPGTQLIFTNKATPQTLLSKLNSTTFEINVTPPPSPKSDWRWIVIALLIGVGIYGLWQLIH